MHLEEYQVPTAPSCRAPLLMGSGSVPAPAPAQTYSPTNADPGIILRDELSASSGPIDEGVVRVPAR